MFFKSVYFSRQTHIFFQSFDFSWQTEKLTPLELALYIVHHRPLIHKGSMHEGRFLLPEHSLTTGTLCNGNKIWYFSCPALVFWDFFFPSLVFWDFYLPYFGILGFFSACFGILGASADVNVLDGCLHAWLSICIEPQCPTNKKAKRKEGESLITPSALTMPACGRRTQIHLNP